MEGVLGNLKGGDRRSIGRSEEVVNEVQANRALQLLLGYLQDDSRIVRTFSMQALADLAMQDRALLPEVLPLIERLTRSGTPAMLSRGRMILRQLRKLR